MESQKKKVMLRLEFEMNGVTCLSMIVVAKERWSELKAHLQQHLQDSIVKAYSCTFDTTLQAHPFTGQMLLDRIVVTDNPRHIDAFETLFGESHSNDDNVLERLVEEFQEHLSSRKKKLSGDIREYFVKTCLK